MSTDAMTLREVQQGRDLGQPIVKVTLLPTTAEEIAEMRSRFSGPGLAVADDAELAVAYDRELARWVELMLHGVSRYDDFTFVASFGDVDWYEVSVEGTFPDDFQVGFRFDGDEPVKFRLGEMSISWLVSGFLEKTMDDGWVAANLSDALYSMGIDGTLEGIDGTDWGSVDIADEAEA